ncbi:MAG: branched-chain amino acid ABC transporter permease [Bacteroidota bacterium]
MGYLSHILILINIYVILTVSTGLIVGLTRMISLGQAAFYGIGAYITAMCIIMLELSLIPSLIMVMLVNGLISLLLALPAIRLKGDYFILATLAFQFIIFSLLNNLSDLTNGSLGISGIGPVSLLGLVEIAGQNAFLLLSAVLALVVVMVFYKLYYSPFGLALKALREDEIALQTMGRNTRLLQLSAFVISSAFIGWASYVFATYMTYIYPGGFHLEESVFILIAVLVGGSGTIRGGIAGAVFVIVIPELLRHTGMPDEVAAPLKQVLFGLILILVMRYRSNGLLGALKL